MPRRSRQPRPLVALRSAAYPLAVLAGWLAVLLIAVPALPAGTAVLVVAAAGLAALCVVLVKRWEERRRWASPLQRLALQIQELARDSQQPLGLAGCAEFDELLQSLRDLKKAWTSLPTMGIPYVVNGTADRLDSSGPHAAMTKSAMLAALPDAATPPDGHASGEFFTADMVSRLEPKNFRWLEATDATQEFLGWKIEQLRKFSLLDILHQDDQRPAREQLQEALVKGEVHGLVLRVQTAKGHPKAIEMSVSARYGPGLAVSYLRCHFTDVTAKLRAERELRLRTRELTQVNGQLRQINRELEELKDRYRDLYQNAPAMYFSLDAEGRFLDCNDTLLGTLGYRREELIGQSYVRILPEHRRPLFAERYKTFLREGTIEMEGHWVKAGGESIDVWVSGTTVLGRDGTFNHSRSVAQDITTKHRLEAELKEKNDRLARTNDELSRKNKEMDEFTYVVSHDLQEPLRTLVAFSDFLLRDCGDRLDANGQEYVRYLVDASRRLRALIHGLLTLSRAGRVTGDFDLVNLGEVVDVVRADLAELVRTRRAEVRVVGPLPELWGDRDRIGQLLANLIGNGLKYNRSEPPEVEVGTVFDSDASWATLYVKDNGIGIDPQFHGKIFQLFRRLHTRRNTRGPGPGWPSARRSCRGTAGRSGSTAGRVRVRRSSSSCPAPPRRPTAYEHKCLMPADFHILLVEDSRADVKIIERASGKGTSGTASPSFPTASRPAITCSG